MKKLVLITYCLFLSGTLAFSEGSRTLAPNYGGTASIVAPGVINNDFAWLEHDGFGTATDNFLDPTAPTNERFYIYLKSGETLRWGIRRIPVRYQAGVAYSTSTIEGNNQDLTIVLYDNAGNIVDANFFDTDVASSGAATLLTSNGGGTTGIISSVAASLLGPQFTFNSQTINTGGYAPIEYTNNTGVDQDFYISFLQADYTFTTKAQLIVDIQSTTIVDADIRSWYDLWDFSVYSANEEKSGRLHCKRWGLTAQYFDNLLADEVNFYVQVPSIIGGVSAGNFIKLVALGGLDPFSLVVYANSQGSDGTDGDTNGDGNTDFQDYRMSLTNEIAQIEYDLFINNPDIELYPTTILPSISITDANFFCNSSTGNGEATIFFESNQEGFIAILLDLNGISGYQDGTADVIVESQITSSGESVIRWNGFDGLGAAVPSGTALTISGRFTSGPIHIPLWDVEDNASGMNMLDVRPATSFNLIYWDDSDITTGASPTVELDGTNTSQHTWNSGDDDLVNTWSFGYYQINTQNVTFVYSCDPDGDGVGAQADLDSDNDGISDLIEGDFDADTDGDNIPDYLDPDVDGDGDVDGSDNWADSNGDGINDNLDTDLDGIPNAIDLDSDNDGLPDLIENGLTDSNNDGIVDSSTDVNGNGIADIYDSSCTGSGGTTTYYAVSQTNNSMLTPANAVGAPDGNYAYTDANTDYIDLNLGQVVSDGTNITLNLSATTTNRNWTASQSTDGVSYTNGQTITITSTSALDYTYTLSGNANNIRLQPTGNSERRVYHISYDITILPCGPGTAISLKDTDGDGVPDYLDIDSDNDGLVDSFEAGSSAGSNGQISGFIDINGNGWNDTQEIVALSRPDTDGDGILYDYLDLDSDNDGILDNYEGQTSASHIATTAGDTNVNGLLDVYDPTNGGTLIIPVDTDSDGTYDFRDTDSDGDGINDVIEGFDSNSNGYADWDSNANNVLEALDFAGFNSDTDGDGIWNVFDPDNGGSVASRQNTENADKRDWQDDDDDNDGDLTSGEDVNTNGNWTDDFTQGGVSIPDYLFRGDYDGDNIADKNDTDSDNDGITDAIESNGAGVDPSGDIDNDGIANYRDTSDAGVTGSISSTTDANADGVYDIFDTDLDGIPDFLDLDSDNDGIWDAIEAYAGSIPNGLNQTKGQFDLNDPDNDGLMNYIDSQPATVGGTSTLSNPDSDGDGLRDYRDIDNDGDGIVDLIESQSTSQLILPQNLDSDGDGIDDAFDPSSGGTLIVPVNSDGLDLKDYLDTDSDNDNVLDVVEGSDSNLDGYGDWDDNQNGTQDEADFTTDSDGDGLKDAFDNVVLGSVGNAAGSSASLQNTDGLDQKDWRDTDDDGDGILTKNEDANANGNYADDHTDGQGISTIPDYLFNGDFDDDGILNFVDADDDNDGITDTNEGYQNVVLTNGDFELPDVTDGTPNLAQYNNAGYLVEIYDASNVAGWNTTAADNAIEVWQSGFNGVISYSGNQHLEINANLSAQLYQDITTEPGSLIFWQIAHRGRDGLDEFEILIGPTTGPISNGSFSTDNTAWVQYSGYYLVPSGQTITRFGFESVSTSSGSPSSGNFIDNFELFVSGTGYDADADGLPDYLDRDSDNDGIPDIIEAGGIDADGDGEVDSFVDTDTDGLHDSYDLNNGGNILVSNDSDQDGIDDLQDLDSDNDGIPDIIEAGGVDVDGNGRVDDATDTDSDGLANVSDPDNGGSPFPLPDTDYDRVPDYKDLDSDNDGITDTVENGQEDTNSDGLIDNYSNDADGDGLADSVDPDSGGIPIANVDTDGDGLYDFRDLDSDNDGYPDIVEAEGIDSDFDGRVDNLLDLDLDGIPNTVDVSQTGGTDVDGDHIDDLYDVTYTGGNDEDGDGIDNRFDADKNGDGYSDAISLNPYQILDSDNDGNKNFRDIDSDNDGIVDVIEFGLTADVGTGTINGFTDTDTDGLNDAQDGIIGTTPNGSVAPVTPQNNDVASEPGSAQIADYLDIDSDNDGIVDLLEAQTKIALISLSGIDSDNDGLDDAFDPSQAGTLITPVNTDGAGNTDYLDNDSDGDTILDIVEGNNANKDQFGDWDGNTNTLFDDSGYNTDTDEDGLLDIFDNVSGNGISNVTGSNAAVQDTDHDGTWDFQDLDDDNDAILTGTDPNSISEDPSNTIPDYLFGDNDVDDDGIFNSADLDADNDGLANADEDGGTGIDPNADNDADGLLNFEDSDIDGDGIANAADTNTSGNNTTGFTDTNNDGVIDQFDFDYDGVPDYRDRDSDNDGLVDILEFGLTDADQDGTLNEGSGLVDANSNGMEDAYDPACDGSSTNTATTGGTLYATNGTFDGTTNILDADNTTRNTYTAGSYIDIQLTGPVLVGNTIDVRHRRDGGTSTTITIRHYDSGFNLIGSSTAITSNNTTTTSTYTVTTSNAYYIRIENTGTATGRIYHVAYTYTIVAPCSGGIALTVNDTDSDGKGDYLDLDSDQDGIPDNREAQTEGAYIAPILTDSDGDGIMNVYDVTGGTPLIPINTDGTDNPDFLDTDSDNDGVLDRIEGWDSDGDGYADWDTNNNNDPTDEGGYSNDNDGDGISYLFDSYQGRSSVTNIIATNASIQDSDEDNTSDYRDDDDDDDGILTNTEDVVGNYLVYTQGGILIPDYLFNPDQDGDGISDPSDEDSDNDGIPNSIEFAGTSPFGDADGDGIYNYLDPQYAGFSDTNNDGVDDRVDRDRDGVPNFFDLDSDNDGIADAIEANGGLVPAGFNTTSGRFNYTGDIDMDGYIGSLDTDDGGSPLANNDTDADGILDFLDLDSDNDGIMDNREAQLTSTYISITIVDTDKDGLKDVYDADNGGSAISPINFDGSDNVDYLDTDSDNDNILDVVEGFDANKNGFSDLDLDSDGTLSDEVGYGLDNDADGLWNIFDNYSGYGIANITGSRSSRQDTDGDATPDYRDNEDDSDGINTSAEDTSDGAGGGSDGIYYNDKTQGGGATPDYLFFNDTDNDGIADGIDLDSDNDGIIDSEEAFGVVYSGGTGPFDDDDNDGIFNYRDSDATGFIDVNADGLDDRVDSDKDGIANFFDLDGDNDGIPDGIEANNGTLPAGQNTNGQFPNSAADVDNDGLADNIDAGTSSTLPLPDTDGDGILDFLDLDSDNDGIVDLVESGGNDYNGDGRLDSFGDTDGDGLGNSVDPNNSGTPLTIPNTDLTSLPDYLDIDSEDDGLYDFIEGFYESGPLDYINSYIARVTSYNSLTSSSNTYSSQDIGPANGIPDYLDDTDGDGIPNIFDPQSLAFFDDDADGIINLFDIDVQGNFYGNVSGIPDRDSDGSPNITDLSDTPLPLQFLRFVGESEDNQVQLYWTTTNEINVSRFIVQHSLTGTNFEDIGEVQAINITSKINEYTFAHVNPKNGYNFYRIKEIDFDDYQDFTKIIYVKMDLMDITWTIYPNPVANGLKIKSNSTIPNAKIRIMNLSGSVLYYNLHQFNSSEATIDLTNYPSGQYVIQIELPDQIQSFRVIKQ